MSEPRAPAIDIALLDGAGTSREPVPATAGADTRTNIFDFDRASLERFFEEDLGEKKFRAHQVMKWIHHRYATEFADMTDLGKALRAKLEARAVVRAPLVVFDKASTDGTHKWLLGMDAKNAIEAVYIPDKGRGTLCVSSQVGCALNCTFCSTGTQGFNRNLSTAEIIGQVWVAARHLGNQRGDDGHGRAAGQFRQRRARDEHHARRPWLRAGQQARHLVHRWPGADESIGSSNALFGQSVG